MAYAFFITERQQELTTQGSMLMKKFSKQVAETICTRIVNGESLSTICQSDGMPCVATIYRWLKEQSEFDRDYRQAKQDRADLYAEQLNVMTDTLEKELRSTNLDNKNGQA